MKKYIGGIIPIAIAIIVLIAGIFICINEGSKNYEKITGEISEINIEKYYSSLDSRWKYHTYVYVDYDYKGESYNHVRLDYYEYSLSQGDKINFYININNPVEITVNLQYHFMIPIVLGGAFLILGIYEIIKIKKSSVY